MTHLFTSTVVRVKGTPLSSSTMKSRWQKGQWPVLSPSSLACRQRGRAQLPLCPSTAAVGAALAGQPQWVQREGGKPHTTHPGQAQAGCRLESSAGSPWHPLCWAGCQPLAPACSWGLHTPPQSSLRGTTGAGPGTPGRAGGPRLPQPHSAKGAGASDRGGTGYGCGRGQPRTAGAVLEEGDGDAGGPVTPRCDPRWALSCPV